MRYFYVTMGMMFLIVACNNSKNKQQKVPEMPTIQKTEERVQQPDSHNSRNSLDYQGTYKGILPTVSGAEVEVTIILTDSTYQETIKYVEKSHKSVETSGKYTWDKDGRIIILEGHDVPNKFRVEENRIRRLDKDGNMITGTQADQYLLKKQF